VKTAKWSEAAGVGERGHDGLMDVQATPLRLQRGAQPLLAAVREGADPRRHVHLVGIGLGDRPGHLGHHVTGTHHQTTAAFPEPGVQIRQTVREERHPVGDGESGRGDGLVAYEERHHGLRTVEGGPQRRVVVQAQVRGEQDDRDGHGVAPGRGLRRVRRRTASARSAGADA
jgi:hypothetical protein